MTQPLTEELRIRKQVDDLLKSGGQQEEIPSAEKIILMQLVASRLKVAKDADELEFYGKLMKRLVVTLSTLSAIDFVDGDATDREEQEMRYMSWGRYLQTLDGQATVKEGLHQVSEG